LPPVLIGPVIVSVVDDPSGGGLTAEQVEFVSLGAGAGVSAVNQGWIEAGGFGLAYVANNLGAVDATVKIIEQIQVG
jgi:hypothetical protein